MSHLFFYYSTNTYLAPSCNFLYFDNCPSFFSFVFQLICAVCHTPLSTTKTHRYLLVIWRYHRNESFMGIFTHWTERVIYFLLFYHYLFRFTSHTPVEWACFMSHASTPLVICHRDACLNHLVAKHHRTTLNHIFNWIVGSHAFVVQYLLPVIPSPHLTHLLV